MNLIRVLVETIKVDYYNYMAEMWTYAELLETEKDLNHLLVEIGLPINNSDRIHLAYKRVRDLEYKRSKDEDYDSYISKNNKDNILNFSIFDLSAIKEILPACISEDSNILKEKFEKILSGNLSSNERDNSVPHNTLFELLMLSVFKKVGLNAHLCEPNPDIELKIGGNTYMVQCKRVVGLGSKSIEPLIKSAVKQLENDIATGPANSFGIIALALDRSVNASGGILTVQSPEKSLEVMQRELVSVIDLIGKNCWQRESIYKNEKILGVILHTRHVVIDSSSLTQYSGAYTLLSNTQVPSTPAFHILRTDLEPLIKFSDD